MTTQDNSSTLDLDLDKLQDSVFLDPSEQIKSQTSDMVKSIIDDVTDQIPEIINKVVTSLISYFKNVPISVSIMEKVQGIKIYIILGSIFVLFIVSYFVPFSALIICNSILTFILVYILQTKCPKIF